MHFLVNRKEIPPSRQNWSREPVFASPHRRLQPFPRAPRGSLSPTYARFHVTLDRAVAAPSRTAGNGFSYALYECYYQAVARTLRLASGGWPVSRSSRSAVRTPNLHLSPLRTVD
jgi:hypothetical protein